MILSSNTVYDNWFYFYMEVKTIFTELISAYAFKVN